MGKVQPCYVFASLSPEPCQGTVRQYHFQCQYLCTCGAIFDDLVASGVFRYVSSYERGISAARIARVKKVVGGCQLADLRSDHSRFDRYCQVFFIKLCYPVHLFKRHHNAAECGQCTARKSCPRTSGCYGYPLCRSDLHDLRDMVGSFRKQQHFRPVDPFVCR